MKRMVVLAVALILLSYGVYGRIRNGYERKIDASKRSLLALHKLLQSDLSHSQRRQFKKWLDAQINCILYYDLTEELLHQLYRVSPLLYREMDNLKDKRGRSIDVYIELVPRGQSLLSLEAASFFTPSTTDEDAHISEYGEHSVSIKLWRLSDALRGLCHELGHVKFVVPNLSSYFKFYKEHYNDQDVRPEHIGHDPLDESGKLAQEYEARFRRDYKAYQRNGGEPLNRMLALRHQILKSNRLAVRLGYVEEI